ncbi:LOB domain-containing protein 29-like [Trifolium pratense]|uniref:LOB domain-containing protein 29-like n=1 Tax=Trifolium pratense TaxID=57577 RepID=A0A2K3N8R9_TRIPR|nr:LOB domain-containing protein 29-like [Trifolium pratense]PNY00312.1 LOB domain-containing protein 29-like [Trifolium pratense]
MAGSSSVSGSPCGACKFLRRKCIRGCVFAPYFSHEQGATHFAAIHKVFGASNVSKLLAHLPVSDRCEAAVTISYEAQARLQDPIYGCVSHIFALQQQFLRERGPSSPEFGRQVVNLQTQLAYLKEQASQTCVNNASTNENPNEKSTTLTPLQDLQSLFHVETSNSHQLRQEFHTNNLSNISSTTQYYVNNNNLMDLNPMSNYENSRGVIEENSSFSSFEESTSTSMSYDMQTNRRTWGFDEVEDLHSVAFGYS